MDPSKIVDHNSLEAWLQDRPEGTHRAEAAAIAQRIALRVLPFYLHEMNDACIAKTGVTALPAFRAAFVPAPGHKDRSPEMEQAVRDADIGYDAANTAAASVIGDETPAKFAGAAVSSGLGAVMSPSAKGAIICAGQASVFADLAVSAAKIATAHDDIWASIRADAKILEKGEEDPCTSSLWPDEQSPEWFINVWVDSYRMFKSQGPYWNFWIAWLKDMCARTFVPWSAQEQIALIDNAIWEEGPEAIAKKIAEIVGPH